MYWLEFDTDVLSYNTPGIVVNYQSNGKEKSHTPDFQVVRYQKKQIIEVKSQKTVESEKYIRLYQMLSGLYDETGWTGGVNPMPLSGIETLLEKANLSSAKAERELGATFRPLRETLKDTVTWYRAQHYL